MSIIGGINFGNLSDYLFLFTNGSVDANWQGASKGFIGNTAVDGIKAAERTSGSVPYAGTISTNDTTLDAWDGIVTQNPSQATGSTGQGTLIASLESDLISVFHQINALPATPLYENVSSALLNGLNTQNGINEVFVINITSGFTVSSEINITGDPGDVYILRWDTDANPANGYQGQVKMHSGGAIVPHGGLTAANFINVAGDITSSGGGSNPAAPYPQGPRYNDGTGALISGGTDWNGGGFFTGYWLTTGSPTLHDMITGLYYGKSSSLSNGIFVGGWYTISTKFSMTSGTSGVYVSPNPASSPTVSIKKEVSVDNGLTWFDANTPTGPTIPSSTNPKFRFTASNTGNVALTNVSVTDDIYGSIGSIPTIVSGASSEWVITEPWGEGQQVNTASVTAVYQNQTFTAADSAYWFGVLAPTPAIRIDKLISVDDGITYVNADSPPYPILTAPMNPMYKFIITNIGNVTLTQVSLSDTDFDLIIIGGTLSSGASSTVLKTGTFAAGQHCNTASATGVYVTETGIIAVKDEESACYNGIAEPSIKLIKYVSVDNETTWLDANTPPGPLLPPNMMPKFKIVVTNNGAVTLTDIVVTDNILGAVGTLPNLDPGESFEWIMG